jgi:hypothetical protein
MGVVMIRLAPIALVALSACGPIPVDRAEKLCLDRAYAATGPHGNVAFGANSAGQIGTKFELNISSDFIAGRDPSAIFDACVYQKSGQPPSRPLYTRPDWKG